MSDKTGKSKHKDKPGHKASIKHGTGNDRMNIETKSWTPDDASKASGSKKGDIGSGRVIIEEVTPELDGGRHPIKVTVGDRVTIEADVFTDGHEKIACDVLWRPIDQDDWNRERMVFVANDRWRASFQPSRNIRHLYTIEGWRDPFASLLDGIVKKRVAGVPLAVEASEAVDLVAKADPRGTDLRMHKQLVNRLDEAAPASDSQLDLIADPDTKGLLSRCGPRHQLSRYDRELTLIVDRKAAVFSAWYELFPRSITDNVERHGTFRDVIRHLPYVQDLGFDVPLFSADQPDRQEKPQGPQQHADTVGDRSWQRLCDWLAGRRA